MLVDAGIISGIENIAPRTCMEVIKLFNQGKLDEVPKFLLGAIWLLCREACLA